MTARQTSRELDVLTAVLLGVVSLTTALGAWQASDWTLRADDYAESASDARDVGITFGVALQSDERRDTDAVLQARKFALLEDAAIVSGDARAAAYSGAMVDNQLGRVIAEGLAEAFPAWRQAGFPADANPIDDPVYQANLHKDADAYQVVAQVASELKDSHEQRAAILAQGAVINALSLFLLGVAGINRLRTARIATLALGVAAFVGALVVMATAY